MTMDVNTTDISCDLSVIVYRSVEMRIHRCWLRSSLLKGGIHLLRLFQDCSLYITWIFEVGDV